MREWAFGLDPLICSCHLTYLLCLAVSFAICPHGLHHGLTFRPLGKEIISTTTFSCDDVDDLLLFNPLYLCTPPFDVWMRWQNKTLQRLLTAGKSANFDEPDDGSDWDSDS